MAVYADEDGLFGEDMADACVSCGMTGLVSIDDSGEENITASWVVRDDEAIVAAWCAAHPERAAEMDIGEATDADR